MTQPVYDPELIVRMAKATEHLDIPIFIGIMPLASGRNAEYLHNEVPGIQLSAEVRGRMQGLEGEAGRAEGVKIAQELLDAATAHFNGIYLITPFMFYDMSVQLLEYIWAKQGRKLSPLFRYMTGYGQSSLQFGGHKIMFEVKSVNNRYCEVVLRMPRDWTGYEDMLRRLVQAHIKRGRVDVIINRELTDGAADGQTLNRSMVKSYLDAAEALSREYGFKGELTLRDILSMPGVMEFNEEVSPAAADSSEEISELLEKGLRHSLEGLLEMRAREGAYLAADLSRRLDHLEELHAGISGLAPLVVSEYREKLRQRLSGLNDGSFQWDEHKFGMEVAVFADRCNIDEELTRLYSHFGQCRALLLESEPAGRKLDFLIQEMNRETNTIGSKCNHLAIVNLTLDMKAELEKIREQAANLE
ncbi:hypothetical protein KC345_g11284 [Hortaea werneckii]|nr:hypothetical protein KC345_g11284 [Hortaea werneckii]